MFEEFLNHRCSIYHPEQVETKTKYGIKAAQSEMCKATPDLEDVPCHFYVNSSLAIKQNEPFASVEGEAKLALPYGTDIRENDFVKSRDYMFRAGIPKAVHGNHHIVVTIRREDGIKGAI